MEQMKSKKLYGISLARIASAFGVMLCHYGAVTMQNSPLFYFANGRWNSVIVSIFFLLSGYVMYMSQPLVTDITSFYKKRFLRLMPMFWMVYLVAFIDISLANFSFSWGGHPATLIFSVLGLDGLMNGYMRTFYLCGEWFLGVIIICYLLYPLLAKLFAKIGPWLLVITAALAAIALRIPFFENRGHENVMYCIFIFTVGMAIRRYGLLDKLYYQIGSVLISAVVILVKLPVTMAAADFLAALGCLTVLNILGAFLGKCSLPAAIMDFLDPITYPLFLVHHMVMMRYVAAVQPQGAVKKLTVLFFSTLLSIVFAWALKVVHDYMMKAARGQEKKREVNRG